MMLPAGGLVTSVHAQRNKKDNVEHWADQLTGRVMNVIDNSPEDHDIRAEILAYAINTMREMKMHDRLTVANRLASLGHRDLAVMVKNF